MVKRRVPMLPVLALLLLAGCTTARESFPGQDPDRVWTAMVAAARSPDYEGEDPEQRWTVRENNVWLADGERRIEIHRELARSLYRPGQDPRHERRTWRLRVTMVEDEKTGVPAATFISRDWAIPSRVWEEALRYFDDVWQLLGGRPVPAEPTLDDQKRADAAPAGP